VDVHAAADEAPLAIAARRSERTGLSGESLDAALSVDALF